MAVDPQDIALRVQALEAVAGKRPGTWSRNTMRGWAAALEWAKSEAPDIHPAWLSEKDWGFYVGSTNP